MVPGKGGEDVGGGTLRFAEELGAEHAGDIVQRAAQHRAAEADARRAAGVTRLGGEVEQERERLRQRAPVVAAGEVVRDWEVDEVVLDGDRLGEASPGDARNGAAGMVARRGPTSAWSIVAASPGRG